MKKTYVIILSVILVMAIAACNPYGGIPVGPGGLPIIPGDNPSEDPGTDVSTEEGLKEALSDPTVKKINLTTDVPVPADGLNISTDKEFAGTGALEFTAAPSNSPAIVIADGADVTGLNLIVGSGTDGASMLQSKSADDPIYKFISVTGNGTVMSRVSITVNKIDNASYNAITVEPGVTGFQFKDGTITGDITDYSNLSEYTANMGIDFNSGASGSVTDSTITGFSSPIYSSSPDITIDGVHFESGIELELVDDGTVVKNCTDVDGGYRAKVNIMTKDGGTTPQETAEAKLTEFVKSSNNSNVFITIDSADQNSVRASYLQNFGTMRLFNNLFNKASGSGDQGFGAECVFDEASATATFTNVKFTDYSYADKNEDLKATGTSKVILTGTVITESDAKKFKVTDIEVDFGNLTVKGGNPSIVYIEDFSFSATVGDGSNGGLKIPVNNGDLEYTPALYNGNQLSPDFSAIDGVRINGWTVK